MNASGLISSFPADAALRSLGGLRLGLRHVHAAIDWLGRKV